MPELSKDDISSIRDEFKRKSFSVLAMSRSFSDFFRDNSSYIPNIPETSLSKIFQMDDTEQRKIAVIFVREFFGYCKSNLANHGRKISAWLERDTVLLNFMIDLDTEHSGLLWSEFSEPQLQDIFTAIISKVNDPNALAHWFIILPVSVQNISSAIIFEANQLKKIIQCFLQPERRPYDLAIWLDFADIGNKAGAIVYNNKKDKNLQDLFTQAKAIKAQINICREIFGAIPFDYLRFSAWLDRPDNILLISTISIKTIFPDDVQSQTLFVQNVLLYFLDSRKSETNKESLRAWLMKLEDIMKPKHIMQPIHLAIVVNLDWRIFLEFPYLQDSNLRTIFSILNTYFEHLPANIINHWLSKYENARTIKLLIDRLPEGERAGLPESLKTATEAKLFELKKFLDIFAKKSKNDTSIVKDIVEYTTLLNNRPDLAEILLRTPELLEKLCSDHKTGSRLVPRKVTLTIALNTLFESRGHNRELIEKFALQVANNLAVYNWPTLYKSFSEALLIKISETNLEDLKVFNSVLNARIFSIRGIRPDVVNRFTGKKSVQFVEQKSDSIAHNLHYAFNQANPLFCTIPFDIKCKTEVCDYFLYATFPSNGELLDGISGYEIPADAIKSIEQLDIMAIVLTERLNLLETLPTPAEVTEQNNMVDYFSRFDLSVSGTQTLIERLFEKIVDRKDSKISKNMSEFILNVLKKSKDNSKKLKDFLEIHIKKFLEHGQFDRNSLNYIKKWMIEFDLTSIDVLKTLWKTKTVEPRESESGKRSESGSDSSGSLDSPTEKTMKREFMRKRSGSPSTPAAVVSSKSSSPLSEGNDDGIDSCLLKEYFKSRFSPYNSTHDITADLELLESYSGCFEGACKVMMGTLEQIADVDDPALSDQAKQFLINLYTSANSSEKEIILSSNNLLGVLSFKLFLHLFSEASDLDKANFFAKLTNEPRVKLQTHFAQFTLDEQKLIIQLIFQTALLNIDSQEKIRIMQNFLLSFYQGSTAASRISLAILQEIFLKFSVNAQFVWTNSVKKRFVQAIFSQSDITSWDILEYIIEKFSISDPEVWVENTKKDFFESIFRLGDGREDILHILGKIFSNFLIGNSTFWDYNTKQIFLKNIFLPANNIPITLELVQNIFEKIPVSSWSEATKKIFLQYIASKLDDITLHVLFDIKRQFSITNETRNIWTREIKKNFFKSNISVDERSFLAYLNKISACFPKDNVAFWTDDTKLDFLDTLFPDGVEYKTISFTLLLNILNIFPVYILSEQQLQAPNIPASLQKFRTILNKWIDENLPKTCVEPVWKIFSEKQGVTESQITQSVLHADQFNLAEIFKEARAIGALDETKEYIDKVFPAGSEVSSAKIKVCGDWLIAGTDIDSKLIVVGAADDNSVTAQITQILLSYKDSLLTQLPTIESPLLYSKLEELYNTLCLGLNLGGEKTEATFEVFAGDATFFTFLMGAYDRNPDALNNPNNQRIRDILRVLFMANPTELFKKLSENGRVEQWYFLVRHLELQDLMNEETDVLRRARVQEQDKLKSSDISTAIDKNNVASKAKLPDALNMKKRTGWLFSEQKKGYLKAYIPTDEWHVLRNIYEHQYVEFSLRNKTPEEQADIRVERYTTAGFWNKLFTWTSTKIKLRSPYFVQPVQADTIGSSINQDAKALFDEGEEVNELKKTSDIQILVTRIINAQKPNAEPKNTFLLHPDTHTNLATHLEKWKSKSNWWTLGFTKRPSSLMKSLRAWDSSQPLPKTPHDVETELKNLVKAAVKLALKPSLTPEEQISLQDVRHIFKVLNEKITENRENDKIIALINSCTMELFKPEETNIIASNNLASVWAKIIELETQTEPLDLDNKVRLLKNYDDFLIIFPENKIILHKMLVLRKQIKDELDGELLSVRTSQAEAEEVSSVPVQRKLNLLRETYEKLAQYSFETSSIMEKTVGATYSGLKANLKTILAKITEIHPYGLVMSIDDAVDSVGLGSVSSRPNSRVRLSEAPQSIHYSHSSGDLSATNLLDAISSREGNRSVSRVQILYVQG